LLGREGEIAIAKRWIEKGAIMMIWGLCEA
jgi:hypothetical protein